MLPAASQAATLVDISATGLPLGPVTSWSNAGSLGGNFTSTGSPQVILVAGYRTVRLNGGGDYFTGPAADSTITGVNKPVTVEAWVHNPNIPGEETVVAWAARRLGRPVKWVASRNESFLSDNPDWRLEPPPEGSVPAAVLDAGRLRVLPQRHGTDGAFAARLRRSDSTSA